MPPRNAARALLSETALAARIAYEREKRGMTYEGLAKRMTDAGCPINQSAIYKIEKGTKDKSGNPGPARRITVEELLALSRVFDLPVEELLLPPEEVVERVALELLEEIHTQRKAASQAELMGQLAKNRLAAYLRENPAATAAVARIAYEQDLLGQLGRRDPEESLLHFLEPSGQMAALAEANRALRGRTNR